jgi:hypothetical protein
MKTKQEIDELYHKCWDEFSGKYDDNLHYYSFVEGYTQCQKDMADKRYTEEDMLKCWNYLMVAMTNKNPVFFKDYINSLNKKD